MGLQAILSPLFPFVANMDGIPFAVFVVVMLATLIFLGWFVPKAFLINKQVRDVISGIQKLKSAVSHNSLVTPSDVGELMKQEPYAHLWAEYDDTLHRLKRYSSENGNTTEVRATVPAETYFTQDTLVDSRLFDEFVRHLPGILTGLGIIGTFAGLLMGLDGFSPSEDAASARQSLKHLLDGVGHAFYASAFAIGCAMLITFVEKLAVAVCYKRVEQLNHEVDALYNTGAGEEYLSRLVEASETNAAQTAQLKDALVEDLHQMMTNLIDRQIEASRQHSELLGERIGRSISEGLAVPMEQIAGVVEKASGQQGSAVQGMLENLLAAFMAKLEDTFGQQMHNINNAMMQSTQSMASVQSSLEQLIGDIGKAGQDAATQMSSKLEESMARAADGQEQINGQMREFVSEIRRLIEEQQRSSKSAMDEAVKGVLEQMSLAMQKLADDRVSAGAADQMRHESLTTDTKNLYSGLSTEVSGLIERIGEAVTKTETNISRLQDVSIRAISDMNDGARTMNVAAGKFTEAGNSVKGVLERSDSLSQTLLNTAQSLQSSAAATKQAIDQYDRTRSTVERYVGELTTLIETAKREAGVSKSLVQDMERIVSSLKGVEEQSVSYLNEVNVVLQKSFKEFGTAMSGQVAQTIGQTDKHLSGSVLHINGILQELGAQLARLKRA